MKKTLLGATMAATLLAFGAAHAQGSHGYNPRGDMDRDGIQNRYDNDRDGDGVANARDPAPNNPRIPGRAMHRNGPNGDLDRDGIRNRHDRDRDGDGVANSHDRWPDNHRRA